MQNKRTALKRKETLGLCRKAQSSKLCDMMTVFAPLVPWSSTATRTSVQSYFKKKSRYQYQLLGSNWNTDSAITLMICVSVWKDDSATRASSRQRCSSRMLEAIVTEKGVKALLWSLASSATERNCFEPSRMAERTWREQARVWNDKTFLLVTADLLRKRYFLIALLEWSSQAHNEYHIFTP